MIIPLWISARRGDKNMNRLWVRLTFAFVAVTLVGVVAVAILTDWTAGGRFRDFLFHQQMMSPGGLTDDLSTFYQQRGNWNGVAQLFSDSPMMPFGRGRGMGMLRGGPPTLFADANGRVVYDDRGVRVGTLMTPNERANAVPVISAGNTVGYLFVGAGQIGALAPAEQEFLLDLRRTLVLAALGAGGLGILIGLIVSRALAAPLTDLANAARAFAGRDWSRRVQERGTDEIAAVAREFNSMADALQSAEMQRRNLMADIAHELRTPLTVLQGNLRAMLDEVYPLERKEIATLYDETRLLSRLVDDLRELALAESGRLHLNLQPVDLGQITHAAITNFVIAADAQNIHLSAQGDETLRVRADPDRLAQILRNLLANALRYTPSGGQIIVASEVTQDGKFARVNVTDTGVGIARRTGESI
jgi:two-component system OmpR family sensor kinase/two-component system sensor histidine kinase BaeS